MEIKTMRIFRMRSRGLAAATALALLLLGLAACESDDTNAVGMDLVDVEIDALLQTVDVYDVPEFRNIPIIDSEVPYLEQQVLYLGEQNGNASSIVVQFDFGAFLEEMAEVGLTADDLVAANLSGTNMRLFILQAFVLPDDEVDEELEDYAWYKSYEIYELAEEVDPSAYPGGVEPLSGNIFNSSTVEVYKSKTIDLIDVKAQDLADAIASGEVRSYLIRETDFPGTGMIGYSSNEMRYGGTTLGETGAVDYLGPVINLKYTPRDTSITIPSIADFSTFHTIVEAPKMVDGEFDSFIMRTTLRNFPALYFDLEAIPKDVFINRAILTVVNDTTRAWGTLESIVASEFDPEMFGAEGDSLDLDELEAELYPVTGRVSVDPNNAKEVSFDLTTSIQRYVNGAYEGTRGYILTPGEDFLPAYDSTALDPDFYFNQFTFHGTAAHDTLRPRLLVTYAASEEVQGGGK